MEWCTPDAAIRIIPFCESMVLAFLHEYSLHKIHPCAVFFLRCEIHPCTVFFCVRNKFLFMEDR